jgi:predicted peroxiredoxin
MEYEVEVIMTGRAGELAIKGVAEKLKIKEDSPKNVYDFIKDAHEAGVKFKVCTPTLDLWGKELIPEIEETVGGAYVISQAMDDDVVPDLEVIPERELDVLEAIEVAAAAGEDPGREQPGIAGQDQEVAQLATPGPVLQVGGELLPLLDGHQHAIRVACPEGQRVAAVAGPDLQLEVPGRGPERPLPVRVQVERDGRFVFVRKDHPPRSLAAFR